MIVEALLFVVGLHLLAPLFGLLFLNRYKKRKQAAKRAAQELQ